MGCTHMHEQPPHGLKSTARWHKSPAVTHAQTRIWLANALCLCAHYFLKQCALFSEHCKHILLHRGVLTDRSGLGVCEPGIQMPAVAVVEVWHISVDGAAVTWQGCLHQPMTPTQVCARQCVLAWSRCCSCSLSAWPLTWSRSSSTC